MTAHYTLLVTWHKPQFSAVTPLITLPIECVVYVMCFRHMVANRKKQFLLSSNQNTKINVTLSVAVECLLTNHQPSTKITQYHLVLNVYLTHNTTAIRRKTRHTNQEPTESRKHRFPAKGRDIHVTGHGGQLSCETYRLPHFLENRLTDVCECVSLTRRPPFTPRKIPGTHFY
jgi:hypothetical protein